MARPRLDVDEESIVAAHTDGASIASLAVEHGVDRTVIRRVIRETGTDATVLQFPKSHDPVAPRGFVTSTVLLERTGATYRQLDYWVRAGLLHTATAPNPGTGNARFYPVGEIAVARLMGRFVVAGVTPRTAAVLARQLAETGTTLLAGIRLDLPDDHL